MNLPTPVTLPYQCTDKLPSPLPTTEEIHNAQVKLSSRREVWERSGVCSIREYAVKYGNNVGENEGNALLFLEKNRVLAPRLYAMYREASSGHVYLIMERLAGHDLESLWPTLEPQDKSSIATQLRSILTQIRSISPPSLFGGVCGGGIPDTIFETNVPDSRINGPFRTSSEVASAISLVLQNNGGEWMTDYLCRHVPTVLGDFPVTFTHGDFHMGNIMVEKTPVSPSQETSTHGNENQWSYQVTGLVDWESAGWYPAYWDYVTAVARPPPEKDWPKTVDAILEPYPAEAYPLCRDTTIAITEI
ncbi:hypothetical protein FPSE_10523 [Fusarium pseudograminearum CS3096]|uniref:Aminoglycoside phosphotransferase domain-containing protein n=1 Tax=Fusarium pseudograminearum (strain CS3096) TaxID=1028729 RepID=K3VXP7_FUSPC|nr:hypothetical protein FPSE_10523 [Fusarium pseudograminearum CS3096]EKJ69270.1 hypothetical protein FPSE_10523 [Fusarium pseudograminearum CS3096]